MTMETTILLMAEAWRRRKKCVRGSPLFRISIHRTFMAWICSGSEKNHYFMGQKIRSPKGAPLRPIRSWWSFPEGVVLNRCHDDDPLAVQISPKKYPRYPQWLCGLMWFYAKIFEQDAPDFFLSFMSGKNTSRNGIFYWTWPNKWSEWWPPSPHPYPQKAQKAYPLC